MEIEEGFSLEDLLVGLAWVMRWRKLPQGTGLRRDAGLLHAGSIRGRGVRTGEGKGKVPGETLGLLMASGMISLPSL
jgi:hypothetical protein